MGQTTYRLVIDHNDGCEFEIQIEAKIEAENLFKSIVSDWATASPVLTAEYKTEKIALRKTDIKSVYLTEE